MEKRWVINQEVSEQQINDLSVATGLNKVLCNLLLQRGQDNKDAVEAFFNPSLEDLHDPFLMKDMDKAVTRLQQAISNNEGILVYGDYDVDGTTSVALVYSYLSKLTSNIKYYIPDRYIEGYGVSYKGIDFASDNNFSLLIVLDCGVKAVDKVKYAKEKGIDFIICDHHTPGEELPDAVAVLDPKRKDCNYPFKFLSGCGVGYKLIQAYTQKENLPKDNLEATLDLLSVSIASDIVPIMGENRVLAHFGLKKLNSAPSLGLATIKDLSGLDNNTTINDIVFKIGPRINASGRVESGSQSVDLLTSETPKMAKKIGDRINNINDHRKELDHKITEDALKCIKDSEILKNKKTTVLYNGKWHKGVIGIVASRLTESYYRPTVILTESNGMATGSARSVEGYDLYSAISECSDLLENYGGHKYAAGLTLKTENIKAFIEKFDRIVSETITEDMLIPQINIDSRLDFKDIDFNFYDTLKKFAPFGPHNTTPVFITENVVDYGYTRAVGKNGEHLKLVVTDDTHALTIKNGIAFGMGNLYKKIHDGKPFDICYTLQENDYMGKKEIQMLIRDIRFR